MSLLWPVASHMCRVKIVTHQKKVSPDRCILFKAGLLRQQFIQLLARQNVVMSQIAVGGKVRGCHSLETEISLFCFLCLTIEASKRCQHQLPTYLKIIHQWTRWYPMIGQLPFVGENLNRGFIATVTGKDKKLLKWAFLCANWMKLSFNFMLSSSQWYWSPNPYEKSETCHILAACCWNKHVGGVTCPNLV